MDTRDTLLDIFSELQFESREIDDSTRLKAELGIDSTELAEISVAIEQRFPIVVDDGELQRLETFGDVIKYIETARYQQL
jgi:acyl carrier protein